MTAYTGSIDFLRPRRDSDMAGTIISTDEEVKTMNKSKSILAWVLTLTILLVTDILGFTKVFPFTRSIK